MTIDEVMCNSSNKNPPFEGKGLSPGDGAAEVKVHPKLLEVLASSEDGIFSLSDIDQKYSRVNPGNSDSTKLMVLYIMYSPDVDYSFYHHTPGTSLTWNQFVRNGRPTKIKVREQEYISKP